MEAAGGEKSVVSGTKSRPRLTVNRGTETASLQPQKLNSASDNELEKVGQ